MFLGKILKIFASESYSKKLLFLNRKIKFLKCIYWSYWHMPVILTLGMWRQEDQQFKASLGYVIP